MSCSHPKVSTEERSFSTFFNPIKITTESETIIQLCSSVGLDRIKLQSGASIFFLRPGWKLLKPAMIIYNDQDKEKADLRSCSSTKVVKTVEETSGTLTAGVADDTKESKVQVINETDLDVRTTATKEEKNIGKQIGKVCQALRDYLQDVSTNIPVEKTKEFFAFLTVPQGLKAQSDQIVAFDAMLKKYPPLNHHLQMFPETLADANIRMIHVLYKTFYDTKPDDISGIFHAYHDLYKIAAAPNSKIYYRPYSLYTKKHSVHVLVVNDYEEMNKGKPLTEEQLPSCKEALVKKIASSSSVFELAKKFFGMSAS